MKKHSEYEIRGAIRRLISERVDEVSLDDSASLLEGTNLDSLGVVELLLAIEEEFSISIDFVAVDPESLLSISGLTHHLSMLMDESNVVAIQPEWRHAGSVAGVGSRDVGACSSRVGVRVAGSAG